MSIPQIKFVNFINKYIWKSREYLNDLKRYKKYLLKHIELLEKEIKQNTENDILERLIDHRQERMQELEFIKGEIIYSENKQKYYIEIANQYIIFG